ncbi:MAG TPA: SirB2 family protein [Burkholderiales bacterium]|nr:SirB2 family protein [Burkholderiales bacterium]
MDYSTLRLLHAGSAVVSLTLFIVRGAWMMSAPQRLQRRWAKIVPHIVDTVLLVSALALIWQLGGVRTLGTQTWLLAKIVALLLYIVLGSVALKRGRTLRTRVIAFFAAIAVFGYIVSVAIAKSPYGFISWL